MSLVFVDEYRFVLSNVVGIDADGGCVVAGTFNMLVSVDAKIVCKSNHVCLGWQ